MFRDLREVESYFVYSYEHLDDLTFLQDPAKVLASGYVEQPTTDWLEAVGKLLRHHGWEGDGDIEIMWLPPFVGIGVEDTHGFYAWAVKQSNNGTTWIASPDELAFPRLLRQNNDRPIWKGLYAVAKGRDERNVFFRELDEISAQLSADMTAVTAGPRSDGIRAALVERAQNEMVQALQAFIDHSYLQMLVEVIDDGNRSSLKLMKSSVRLDPSDYVPEGSEGDTEGWFTLKGLISDMWSAFKFEAFDRKMEMLIRPLGLAVPKDAADMLRKHVFLRNCQQHHRARVDTDGLARLGRTFIEIATDSAPIRLERGARITMTPAELSELDRRLREFGRLLEVTMADKIVSRGYGKE